MTQPSCESAHVDPVREALQQATASMLAEPKASTESAGTRIELDKDNVRKGLAQLVLTLVKLLHELMERQAIRRMDAGGLSDQQIEDLGITLMRQAEEIEALKKSYGLEDADLSLDLGPLGRLV